MTTTNTRIGIYAPISHPFGLSPREDVLGFLSAVDERGFDSLWVGDHLLWHGTLLESTAVLAAAAACTHSVDIGTNIYLPGLRPALVSARNLGTIAYLSGGRFVFGVGLGGENTPEFEALGLDVRRRRRLFDDALDEVLRSWESGRNPATGEVVSPVPDTTRLWIGGRAEIALRRTVARRAEAWSAHLMSAERVATSRRLLHEFAEEADTSTPDVAVTLFVDVRGRDEEGRRFLAAHFGDGSETLLRYVISGDVEECREQIGAYLEVAEHVLLFPATARPWTQLDELTELAQGLREEGRDVA